MNVTWCQDRVGTCMICAIHNKRRRWQSKKKVRTAMRTEIECHSYLIVCKNNEFALPKRYHNLMPKIRPALLIFLCNLFP